jgi:hypothetical protein
MYCRSDASQHFILGMMGKALPNAHLPRSLHDKEDVSAGKKNMCHSHCHPQNKTCKNK